MKEAKEVAQTIAEKTIPIQSSSHFRQIEIQDKLILQEKIKFEEEQYDISKMGSLVELINFADPLSQIHGFIGLRRIFARIDQVGNNPQIQKYEAEILERCLLEIKDQSTSPINQFLKSEAAHIICNLALSSKICAILSKKEQIKNIVLLISSERGTKFVGNLLWTISNLAADSKAARDAILSAGGLPIINRVVDLDKGLEIRKIGILAICNIFRSKELKLDNEGFKQAFTHICQALHKNYFKNNQQNILDLVWAASYYTQNSQKRIQEARALKLIEAVFVYCAADKPYTLLIPVLRIIGIFATGNEAQTQQILKIGFLQRAESLVDHQKNAIKREISWILSNIAAGSQAQKKVLLGQKSLMKKIHKVFKSSNSQIKKQICWIYGNLAKPPNTFTEILAFFQQNEVFHSITEILNQQEQQNIICDMLQITKSILSLGRLNKSGDSNLMMEELMKISGFTEKIQFLQYHESEKVYSSCCQLLQKYFETE